MAQSYQQLNIEINKSSQQQDLQLLFGYFDEKKQYMIEGGKQQQIQENIQQNKNVQDYNDFENENKLYEGCYSQENQEYNLEQYENFSNDSNMGNSNNNRFVSYNSYNVGKKFLNRIKNASDFSCSQKISNQRNLKALLSNRKIKKQYSQDTRSLGSNSSSKVNTNNLKFKKNKKQKVIMNEEFIFINPFISQPSETINISKFKKFSSENYEELFKRIEAIYKKMNVYGQKLFFKQKQNQEQLDNLLASTGLKISKKLGKSKAFREFKAIYYYLKLINSQKDRKDEQIKKTELFQRTYLDQFRQLMEFEKNIDKFQQRFLKNSLFGFSASKTKKQYL